MMFEKKYIKMLFATETFAVGINMPTKTVLFSGLTKFNGSVMRYLNLTNILKWLDVRVDEVLIKLVM